MDNEKVLKDGKPDLSYLDPPYKLIYRLEDGKICNYSAIIANCADKEGKFKAWKYASGEGIDVVIVDTGISTKHPDLNVKGGYNAIMDKPDHYDDDNGHGTAVAGIACATGAYLFRGIAPKANLWAVKALDEFGQCIPSWIIRGLQWVLKKIGDGTLDKVVVNMSFGFKYDPPGLHDIIRALHSTDKVLMFAAAGNRYPPPHPHPKKNNRLYGLISGTSAASPGAAGCAAVVWSWRPTLTATQMLETLKKHTVKLGDRAKYGNGLINCNVIVENEERLGKSV